VLFAIVLVIVWVASLLAAVIVLLRKLSSVNPEIKFAAKKAAAATATELIDRYLK
jgi:hypothetical protein